MKKRWIIGVALLLGGAGLWLALWPRDVAAPPAVAVDYGAAPSSEASASPTRSPNPAPAPAPTPVAPPANTWPTPVAPKLSAPAFKAVTREGKAFRYVERRYPPGFVLPVVSEPAPKSGHKTVVGAMTDYTSAMIHADWGWFMGEWDEAGKSVIRGKIQQKKRKDGGDIKAAFLDGWKREYSGRRFVLLRQLELPGYVIVYFRREGQPDTAVEAFQPVALKKAADGTYSLTHDLRNHPVFWHEALEGLQMRKEG